MKTNEAAKQTPRVTRPNEARTVDLGLIDIDDNDLSSDIEQRPQYSYDVSTGFYVYEFKHTRKERA